jgi:hypothetical protein
MSSHPWLQSLDTVAMCPKCGKPALHRSRTRTAVEKFRRRYSLKRQFRCHECQWRGWLEETHLRYPAVASPPVPASAVQGDEIPTFDLNDEFQGAPGKTQPISPSKKHDEPSRSPLSTEGSRDASRAAPSASDEIHPPDFYHSDQPVMPVSQPSPSERRGKKRVGTECPECHNTSLFRSRHRGALELLRKNFTKKRTYRCHKCGWRGWLAKT